MNKELEEAAERYAIVNGVGGWLKDAFISGSNWQAERSYNKQEVDLLVNELINKFTNWSGSYVYRDKLIEIYEQNKKK